MPGFRMGLVAASAALLVAVGASAKTYTMKIGHQLPPKTALHVWSEKVKAGLERKAPGSFDVRIFPTSQLGTVPRMIEGVQLGTIEAIAVPPAFMTGVDRRYGVVTAPGIFDDIAHGQRTVHDPEFRKAFWPVGEAKGIKLIGMSCDGYTDYATVEPIRKLADFRGRKIRVFGSRLEMETMRRVGATGVPMPLAEVIPAIQQRTIDGNKAAMPVFVPFGYQRIAKYVLRAGQSIICINKAVSKVWYDRLPRELQQALQEAAAQADAEILPWSIAFNDRLYKIWTKTGGVLTELSPDEQTELRRRLSTVAEAVLKDQPKALAVYEVMKAAAERTRGK